jgi:dTDP-4-dehydrorhamnose reductase
MPGGTRGATALIVGASGQVGYHLGLSADRRELSWSGTFHGTLRRGLQALDVRDARAVARVTRALRPAYILAPVAVSNVDRCELEASTTYRVNVLGIGHLVEAANEAGATIVYFSSDYIFDGADGPYDEHAPTNPLSQYGLQKLSGEHLVLQRAHEALIVRTTVVYGHEPQGKNFVYRLLDALRRQDEIAVPVDQIGTPTYAPALADAVFDLLAAGVRGVVNVTGRQLATREEFAREAASVFGEDPGLVQPVLTSELGQVARRPLRGGLRSELAEESLGRVLPGYAEGLRSFSAEAHLGRDSDVNERSIERARRRERCGRAQ